MENSDYLGNLWPEFAKSAPWWCFTREERTALLTHLTIQNIISNSEEADREQR